MKTEQNLTESVDLQILTAAYDLFMKRGLRAVSVDDVCRQVGVSKKTFYVYYPSKEDLVSAAIGLHQRKIMECLTRELNDLSSIEIFLFAIKKVDVVAAERHDSQLKYELKKYYPRIYEDSWKRYREIREVSLTDYVRKGMDEGYIDKDVNPNLLATYFMAMQDALADMLEQKTLALGGRRMSRKALYEESIRVFSNMLFNERGRQWLQSHLNGEITKNR